MKIIIDGEAVEIPGGGWSSGGVPKGTIVIWSGTAEDIPEGWALCDGQDGRPDLRDKFVLGAGSTYDVGATGGSSTVSLTAQQLPNHSHILTVGTDGDADHIHTGLTYPSACTQNVTNTTNHSTSSAGNGQAHNNMPPYYALCYIIKTAEDSGGSGSGGGGDSSGSGNPVGTVISFLGLTAPAGYLVCDGTAYDISDYPVLAAFFETQFGTKNHFGGDGTTTFAVPDMRNLFLRGYHGEAEEQISGGVGARQEATQIPVMWTTDNLYMPIGSGSPTNYDSATGASKVCAKGAGTLTAAVDYPQLFTSRPVNMAVLYCVKAT